VCLVMNMELLIATNQPLGGPPPVSTVPNLAAQRVDSVRYLR
jgi:hypothetical protein